MMGMTQIKCKCPGELCCPYNGPHTLVSLTQPLLRCLCPMRVVDRTFHTRCQLCRSAVEPACLEVRLSVCPL